LTPVLIDLRRTWLWALANRRLDEVVGAIRDERIQRDVACKQGRNIVVECDRLPRALRLAGAAVDAEVWIDEELIGKVGFSVTRTVLDDAVRDRADLDARTVDAVAA
jgi:hypothetical protein